MVWLTSSKLLKNKQTVRPEDGGQRTEDRFNSLSSVFCPQSSDPCPQSSETGGGERDRTDDPLLAKQVLSQLSYTPVELVRMRG